MEDTTVMETSGSDREFELESEHLADLYQVVDEVRAEAGVHRAEALESDVWNPIYQTEREAVARTIAERIARLAAAENGLVFGKLVEANDEPPMYIGKVTLFDHEANLVLVDWRAPGVERFYRATAAEPMGLLYRRHLITAGRSLLAIEDDLLAAGEVDETRANELVGEAALLHALNRERSGRMGDIVATIQRDQDEIIRAPLKSTMLVTGGPGTGKTVVALHRAAYLLHADRVRVAEHGVLVLGPSNLFLRYIERVLPSLGESAVALADWSSFLPGVVGEPEANGAVADVKGSLAMVDVLKRAVAAFERVPRSTVRVFDTKGGVYSVASERIRDLRAAARRRDGGHNAARAWFERRLAQEFGVDDYSTERETTFGERIAEVANRLWPVVTPADVLSALYSSDALRSSVTDGLLSGADASLLAREAGSPWTVSDLPLLDELRVLLGEAKRATKARGLSMSEAAEVERATDVIEKIQQMLDESGGGDMNEGLSVRITDLISASDLVSRQQGPLDIGSVAHRAQRDPSWMYAHVVVDEAQDVTPMQWRCVARRCQGASMTIVGDPDQATRPMADSLAERVSVAVGARREVTRRSLSVNYRTPSETVVPAHLLRRHFAGELDDTSTRYVRSGDRPWSVHVSDVNTASVQAAVARALQSMGHAGRLAVVAPASQFELVRAAVVALGDVGIAPAGQVAGDTSATRLDSHAAAYCATEVKGLEFDAVVVIDPVAIEAEHGWRQLYVALTRATRQLGIVLVGDTPSEFVHDWIAGNAIDS